MLDYSQKPLSEKSTICREESTDLIARYRACVASLYRQIEIRQTFLACILGWFVDALMPTESVPAMVAPAALGDQLQGADRPEVEPVGLLLRYRKRR